MQIERTDFYSVPVQDMERAKSFYRDTLGMQSPDWDRGFPEIETGNVSLYLVDPTMVGGTFSPHTSPGKMTNANRGPRRQAISCCGFARRMQGTRWPCGSGAGQRIAARAP